MKLRLLACTPHPRSQRRNPSQTCLVHRTLEGAHQQAASIQKPVAWDPGTPFSMFGREGDALLISPDGLCRRVRLWNAEGRKWNWYSCAVFDPKTKTLDPSTHAQIKAAA